MVEKFYCPQCKNENDPSATKCIHCGFNFGSNALDSSSESDWLAFLREPKYDDQTDDSQTFSNVDDSPKSIDDSNEESPDWLKRIRDIKQTDSEFEQMESRKPLDLHSTLSTENDDLIKSLRDEEKQQEEETVDWISDFRNTQEPNNTESSLENDNEVDSEDEISDTASTLEEIKKNWQIEFPSSLDLEDDENVIPAEEFPDWLSKNVSNLSEKDEILDDADIPGWLTPDQDDPLDGESKPPEPFDIPEWLSKANFLAEEEINSNSESESSAESQELIEFLKEINPEKEEQDFEESISEDDSEMDIEETYDSVLLFNKLDILPEEKIDVDENSNNLQESDAQGDQINLNQDQSQPDEPAFLFNDSELKNLSVSPFIGIDENDDWLNSTQLHESDSIDDEIKADIQDSEIEEPKEEFDESFSPFKLGTVPEWLKNVDFDLPGSEISQSIEDDNISDSSHTPEIEKGNLPEWLKAIRPIEAVSPELPRQKPQKRIEKSGPLAGFKGVLSSENLTKNFSPPPAYSATINITDKQKDHLKILEGIISPSAKTTTTIKKPNSFIHRVEIYLIPVFLLLIVIYSSFIDHSGQNLPENLPADAIRFHTLSTGYLNRNELPANILIIFETDASSYSELNLISGDFFESLFTNNHWVTSISTNPNGVLVSEKIMSNVHLRVPSYNFKERITNLGYLPGYGSGIQAFLSNPKETSPGIDLNINIWENRPLSEIDTINDFDMIVLLTDNSENAKLWIEQIHLLVKDPNLLLIATTKASPLIQPYLRTNQVDGMLSGMIGGLAFNLLSQTETNNIGRYWAIVQLTAMVFVFFILAGGVISIFNKAYSEDYEKNK